MFFKFLLIYNNNYLIYIQCIQEKKMLQEKNNLNKKKLNNQNKAQFYRLNNLQKCMMFFNKICINLQENIKMKFKRILILEKNFMNFVIKWMLIQ